MSDETEQAEAEPEPSATGSGLEKRIKITALYEQMVAVGLGDYFSLIVPTGELREVFAGLATVMVTPAVSRIRQEWSRDRQRNGRAFIDAAAEAANRTAEEVFTLASESPKTRILFMKALDAATNTAWDHKVRTLGRAMVQGLVASDETVIDMAGMISAAIADIDEPTLALLELLVAYDPTITVADREPTIIEDVRTYSHESPYGQGSWQVRGRKWSEYAIGRWRPRLTPVLRSLFGTLERHGLIEWDSNINETLDTLARALRSDTQQRIAGQSRGQRSPANLQWRPSVPVCSPTELGEEVYLRFQEAGTTVPDAWTSPNTEQP